ncbi:MAG: 3-deoxy-manno-octulosonate cytidylyltransferase [Planctomycetes bacterium]|nr:3-deoxy-manno-octulosonate cytidylyltransferase [Planctomycetota bacterium]
MSGTDSGLDGAGARAGESAGRGGALRAVAVIPARLASTRLARKMLLAETGAPLVVHTARNVLAAGVFARVVVAVDADELEQAVRAHGLEALRTRDDHPSGTDRVREAWEALRAAGERASVIVGVQGDEPDLAHDDLAQLVAAFEDPAVELATLCAPLEDPGEFEAPSVVKVVRDARGDALYFSRAPIPALSHGDPGAARALRHVGVYAYRPEALAAFTALPRGALERRESLEQLRWLEAGRRLRVVDARRAPRGIDTLEDYREFVRRVAREAAGDGTGRTGGSRGGLAEARAG